MEEKIRQIIMDIRNSRGFDKDIEINACSTLRGDLGLNSFDLAELTVKIEDEFDVDIFEDGLVSTVGEIFAKLQA